MAMTLMGIIGSAAAQETGYQFKDKINIDVTSVKDQHRSGTCWSFASISFLEAELMRVGKGEYDLSEMFLVRNCYSEKAEKYVRMHGKTNFGGGGLAHDMVLVWKKYGLVPEEAYTGMRIGEEGHVHGEMDAILPGYVEQVLKDRNNRVTPVWKKGFDGILDAYLGDYPTDFTYKGKEYTPKSFAVSLEINPDDFVTIGSFSHHPFYEPFILEIPDNWGWNLIENVAIDEMMSVLDNALENGYTVCWDADVSEKGFNWGKGVALIPSESIADLDNLEQGKWSELSDREKQAMFYDFSSPKKEKVITQERRQEWFDNYITTDDHLMHIIGTALDQNGNKSTIPFDLTEESDGTLRLLYLFYYYFVAALTGGLIIID